MSLSISIFGLRELDESPQSEFSKMLAVKIACDNAELDYPEEVEEYFGGCSSCDIDDLRDEMRQVGLPKDCLSSLDEFGNAFEINVGKIPKHIKSLRVILE